MHALARYAAMGILWLKLLSWESLTADAPSLTGFTFFRTQLPNHSRNVKEIIDKAFTQNICTKVHAHKHAFLPIISHKFVRAFPEKQLNFNFKIGVVYVWYSSCLYRNSHKGSYEYKMILWSSPGDCQGHILFQYQHYLWSKNANLCTRSVWFSRKYNRKVLGYIFLIFVCLKEVISIIDCSSFLSQSIKKIFAVLEIDYWPFVVDIHKQKLP